MSLRIKREWMTPAPHGEQIPELDAFVQHMSIAQAQLEDLVQLARRFELSVGFVSKRSILALRQRIESSWEEMWSQLDQARAVAVCRGGDVSSYDRTRPAPGAGLAEQPARSAIDALRAAVPEVGIPLAHPSGEAAAPWQATWKGKAVALITASVLALTLCKVLGVNFDFY